MKKDDVELSFRRGGAEPVLREKMGDYDLFFADGYSYPPHLRLQRFGIEPDQFPGGAYVTIWWLGKDEKLHFGRPLFFEVTEMDKKLRINAARKDAARAVKSMRKH